METQSRYVMVGTVFLVLVLATGLFIYWLVANTRTFNESYDIFFRQSVSGLGKGQSVVFSGVRAGVVEEIKLWAPDPQFVRVRISVDEEIPINQSSTASIQAVGFTGSAHITLENESSNAPPITAIGPAGVPVIPTKESGLGQILNSAPQLVERLTVVSGQLVTLLGEENQDNISKILANLEQTTGAMARSSPALEEAIINSNKSIVQMGKAAEQIARLAETSNARIDPALGELHAVLKSTDESLQSLNRVLVAAEPSMQMMSETTLPETTALVRQLNETSASLASLIETLESEGAAGVVGGQNLPDYKEGD